MFEAVLRDETGFGERWDEEFTVIVIDEEREEAGWGFK